MIAYDKKKRTEKNYMVRKNLTAMIDLLINHALHEILGMYNVYNPSISNENISDRTSIEVKDDEIHFDLVNNDVLSSLEHIHKMMMMDHYNRLIMVNQYRTIVMMNKLNKSKDIQLRST